MKKALRLAVELAFALVVTLCLLLAMRRAARAGWGH